MKRKNAEESNLPAKKARREKPAVPPDATTIPRFAGFATFARVPHLQEHPDFDVAVLGVPFDAGCTYRPGARFGPQAIRQASRLARPYNPSLDIYPFESIQIVDAGDVTCNPFNIDEAIGSIEAAAKDLLARTAFSADRAPRLLTLGGDHTIALPLLRAVHEIHGRVALLHFDAHLDTWDTYFGAPYTHGTPFRRASEENLFSDDHSMHVGIRAPVYSKKDFKDDEEMGFRLIHCEELETLGVAGAVKKIRDRVKDQPLYISIDIDVLDPAFAPGTGTPEAGGMTSRELLGILKGLDGLKIVGCDVVEVSPSYDHAEVTCLAASAIGYQLLSLMAKT